MLLYINWAICIVAGIDRDIAVDLPFCSIWHSFKGSYIGRAHKPICVIKGIEDSEWFYFLLIPPRSICTTSQVVWVKSNIKKHCHIDLVFLRIVILGLDAMIWERVCLNSNPGSSIVFTGKTAHTKLSKPWTGIVFEILIVSIAFGTTHLPGA